MSFGTTVNRLQIFIAWTDGIRLPIEKHNHQRQELLSVFVFLFFFFYVQIHSAFALK